MLYPIDYLRAGQYNVLKDNIEDDLTLRSNHKGTNMEANTYALLEENYYSYTNHRLYYQAVILNDFIYSRDFQYFFVT